MDCLEIHNLVPLLSLFMAWITLLLPIGFAVFVIIFLIKIRNTVEAIQKKLEQVENKSAAT